MSIKLESSISHLAYDALKRMERFDTDVEGKRVKKGDIEYIEAGEKIYGILAWTLYFKNRVTILGIHTNFSKGTRTPLEGDELTACLTYPYYDITLAAAKKQPLTLPQLALGLENVGLASNEASEIILHQKNFGTIKTRQDMDKVVNLIANGNLMGFLDEVEVPPIACPLSPMR